MGLSLGLLDDPLSTTATHEAHETHETLHPDASKEAQKIDLLPTSSYNSNVFARCAFASLWVVDPNLVSQRYAKYLEMIQKSNLVCSNCTIKLYIIITLY